MKILVLIGSYRRSGNTDRAAGLIVTHLRAIAAKEQEPLEVETIHLGQQEISPCRGCRACFDRGEAKCPIKDDIQEIREKMRAADGLLIASPVYVDDVNGITKNWIDRLAHACHRPEFAGKCAYAVVTVGSSPTSHALRTLTLALRTWGFHIAGQAGFKAGALMESETLRASFEQRAASIASRLYQSIRQREYVRPSFVSLMMFRIVQQAWQKQSGQPDTVDYLYWKNKGWLEPQRDFFIPHQSGLLKTALARLTGSAIARFVS